MRITKTVGQFFLGSGSLAQMPVLLEQAGQVAPAGAQGVVWLIDHFFSDGRLLDRLPLGNADLVLNVDSTDEPTTSGIDALVSCIVQSPHPLPVAVVGIGGGATLDSAKAVSNLLGNGGAAADYQGWDLLPRPGIFKIGVPTLSGTGAEASRTCVMMNQEKALKLGMNSDFTVFDRLILDPDLTETVPRDQFFFTGMDTYIHCIESLEGRYRHPLADALSREALNLCREIFLDDDMMSAENREKMMVASYLGGSAIGNSYVGVVHPFSAGLSMAFHTHHCVGNCIVMQAMDEFYGESVTEFRLMAERQGVTIPSGLCRNIDDTTRDTLYKATVVHENPLSNALGDGFHSILTRQKVLELFDRM